MQAAGEYDRVNLGALLSLEHATRRITAIIEALSRGAVSQNWGQADGIQGLPRLGSLLSAERRAEVSMTTKQRYEVELLRAKAEGAVQATKLPSWLVMILARRLR